MQYNYCLFVTFFLWFPQPLFSKQQLLELQVSDLHDHSSLCCEPIITFTACVSLTRHAKLLWNKAFSLLEYITHNFTTSICQHMVCAIWFQAQSKQKIINKLTQLSLHKNYLFMIMTLDFALETPTLRAKLSSQEGVELFWWGVLVFVLWS